MSDNKNDYKLYYNFDNAIDTELNIKKDTEYKKINMKIIKHNDYENVNSRFKYIIDKIICAPILLFPFPHVLIENFFNLDDFNKIISNPIIHFDECSNSRELVDKLISLGYKQVMFPGTTTDIDEYLNSLDNQYHHTENQNLNQENSLTEGKGMTFRLKKYNDDFLKELIKFMNTDYFKNILLNKFEGFNSLPVDIDTTHTDIHTSIQKYLTGYEISPHPDVRRKAMTYLININKNNSISDYDLHTQLLRFKEPYQVIYDFWKYNPLVERCWVPWYTCDTVKTIRSNNSLILFTPRNDTLHAIKLKYPHHIFQRTQIYGNIFYKEKIKRNDASFNHLVESGLVEKLKE